MGKCQYRNPQGEHTCNVDTILFKDNNQEDLFPDLCYFHQVGEITKELYTQLDDFYKLIGDANLVEGTKNINIAAALAHLQVSNSGGFLKRLPFIDIFYENFHKIMSENTNSCINTSGFYFPVKHRAEVILNYVNVSQIWNNQLVLKNYKFYDIEYIDRLIRDIENNQIQDIRNIYDTLKTYENEVLKYGFISHSNFREIKFNISDITFNEDIDIQGWANYLTWDYTFTKCKFNSPKISLQSTQNIKFKEITITSNNESLDISSDYLEITNSSISSKKAVLSASYNSLNLDNTLNKEKLFDKAGEIQIYDLGSGNPLTSKSSFKYVNLRRVVFYPYNKEKTSANNQNLSRIEFVNCDFLPGLRLKENYSIEKYAKYYEYSYRYLRKHYDEKGDYIEGNDFHYNYMEAKKKNSGFWDKLWLYPYGWLNGYNTKPSRTIVALIILIAISTIINTCWGSFAIKDIYDSGINPNKHDWHTALLYSSANVIPLINKDMFAPQGTITLQVTMMENLFGTILIALLLMALRNRFRRSKTTEEIKEN